VRYELKPRSTVELIDGAFKLVRDNLWGFVEIEAPLALLALIQLLLYGGPHHTRAVSLLSPAASDALSRIFMALATGLDRFLLPVATVAAFEGTTVSLEASLRRSWKVRWPLIALTLLLSYSLLFSGSLFSIKPKWLATLLLVPMLGFTYLLIRWSLSFAALFAEPRGALRRSASLLDGAFGRIFWPTLVSLLAYFLGWITVHKLFHATPVAEALCTAATYSFFGPIQTAFVTLLYFDQRIRREGLGLAM